MDLEIENLIKVHQYKKKYYVVYNKANYHFLSGRFYNLVDDESSGKTTLLEIISLVDKRDSGKLIFNGKDVKDISSRDRAYLRNKCIGYVTDHPILSSTLTVRENILLPLMLDSDLDQYKRDELIRDYLIEYGIEEKSDYVSRCLSETDKQKVCLIRALIIKPKLLLLDEPFKNLDSKTIDHLMDVLYELVRSGVTIIFASKEELEYDIVDEVLYIEDRKLVEAND